MATKNELRRYKVQSARIGIAGNARSGHSRTAGHGIAGGASHHRTGSGRAGNAGIVWWERKWRNERSGSLGMAGVTGRRMNWSGMATIGRLSTTEREVTIKSELLLIKEASQDGMLHAETVVEWARDNTNSALHKALEWDDVRAAEEYRIAQVRQLIRIHVISEDGVPQLVSLTFDRTKGGGYREVSDVLKSRDLAEIMLADALGELERVRAKYERVKDLMPVWEQVERVRRRRRVTQPPAQPSAQAG